MLFRWNKLVIVFPRNGKGDALTPMQPFLFRLRKRDKFVIMTRIERNGFPEWLVFSYIVLPFNGHVMLEKSEQ